MAGETFEDLDRAVRLAIYAYFRTTGQAPAGDTVAAALALPVEAVRAAYTRLAERHVIVLQPGADQIWMAMPFSAVATPFRVTSGEQVWWANCAWDALGIPAMLGQDAEIATVCGDCATPLRLQVRDGALLSTETCIHFAVPAAHWWDDIGFT